MDAFVHSTESFGTVDGPGVRFVIFLQGCPMRCKYCHNPDTWEMNVGERRSADSLLAEFERNRPFYKSGGITVTGGEALVQIDFLLELFIKAKQRGIHTCLDTSGCTYREGISEYNRKLDKLMTVTDLVMLDIKHIEPKRHKVLTGHDNAGILAFARFLAQRNVPVWIRHVVVPHVTDSVHYLQMLGEFIATLPNVKALDVLPYHVMGKVKYEQLGIEYPLEGIPAASPQEAAAAKQVILNSFRYARSKMKS